MVFLVINCSAALTQDVVETVVKLFQGQILEASILIINFMHGFGLRGPCLIITYTCYFRSLLTVLFLLLKLYLQLSLFFKKSFQVILSSPSL